LALFVLGWNTRQCCEFFASWAKEAFCPRDTVEIPGFAKFHRWISAYLADSLYAASGIDGALSRCFGTNTSIDDGRSSATAYGTCVAVTAATVPSAEPYLITNYNGIGRRLETCGKIGIAGERSKSHILNFTAYSVVHAPSHPRKLRLWERYESMSLLRNH